MTSDSPIDDFEAALGLPIRFPFGLTSTMNWKQVRSILEKQGAKFITLETYECDMEFGSLRILAISPYFDRFGMLKQVDLISGYIIFEDLSRIFQIAIEFIMNSYNCQYSGSDSVTNRDLYLFANRKRVDTVVALFRNDEYIDCDIILYLRRQLFESLFGGGKYHLLFSYVDSNWPERTDAIEEEEIQRKIRESRKFL